MNAQAMSTKEKQLTLFVTFHVAPESIEAFLNAHRPVWKACSEEPECLLFDVFQDPAVPGKFRFVEVWSKDREWFEREQLTKPYYEELWKKSKPLWIEDPVLEYFERFGEGSVYADEYLAGGRKI